MLITLALSFLIGLQREEHFSGKTYNFGGVRTFPIVGLCGFLIADLSDGKPILLSVGVLVLGALLWLSYRKKLELSSTAGMTSEVSGLFTFLMGALIFHGELWEATTLTVSVLLLLELKNGLESLAQKIPKEEIFTFTRFLLISAVILPIVPNHSYTRLELNPFHTWLIIVAISSLSYGSYVLGKVLGSGRSIVLAAVLGGLYSSTSTTVVLAKRSQTEKSNRYISGAIIIASGLMYFRLAGLVSIFNWSLARLLILPFVALGLIFCAVGGGWIYYEKKKASRGNSVQIDNKNPLELKSALVFALLFTLMGTLTVFTLKYLGSVGMYGLSFLTGLTDVDPFVMSLTQSAGAAVAEQTAVKGIIIAAASNNLMKGIYVAILGGDGVKKNGSRAMVALAIFSLLALFFV